MELTRFSAQPLFNRKRLHGISRNFVDVLWRCAYYQVLLILFCVFNACSAVHSLCRIVNYCDSVGPWVTFACTLFSFIFHMYNYIFDIHVSIFRFVTLAIQSLFIVCLFLLHRLCFFDDRNAFTCDMNLSIFIA